MKLLKPICEISDREGLLRTVMVPCVIIYLINCVLVCVRPEMAKEIGFKKWSRGWTCGLPTDIPHAPFLGQLKSVPGLCELDQNRPYVVCLNC